MFGIRTSFVVEATVMLAVASYWLIHVHGHEMEAPDLLQGLWETLDTALDLEIGDDLDWGHVE